MKTFKFYTLVLVSAVLFTACSDDNDDPIIVEENPLAAFNLLSSFDANNHTLEVYSEQNQYTIGYNQFFFRIKDNATDTYINNATLSINPVMHMEMMSHSCPTSTISTTDEASVYQGFSIFQMPGNETEYWELNVEYGFGGQTYNLTERIEVKAPGDGMKTVNVFTGSDETRYVLAMMPMTPDVKVNDFAALLFKMENMMTFPVVEGYSIEIDPRMPGMGNHSSPNNEHLTFDSSNLMYKGKLSLTMTGYWKINLKVKNATGEVLKGEDVTEENEASSLYFEMEF